jgi:hypothetical protein
MHKDSVLAQGFDVVNENNLMELHLQNNVNEHVLVLSLFFLYGRSAITGNPHEPAYQLIRKMILDSPPILGEGILVDKYIVGPMHYMSRDDRLNDAYTAIDIIDAYINHPYTLITNELMFKQLSTVFISLLTDRFLSPQSYHTMGYGTQCRFDGYGYEIMRDLYKFFLRMLSVCHDGRMPIPTNL